MKNAPSRRMRRCQLPSPVVCLGVSIGSSARTRRLCAASKIDCCELLLAIDLATLRSAIRRLDGSSPLPRGRGSFYEGSAAPFSSCPRGGSTPGASTTDGFRHPSRRTTPRPGLEPGTCSLHLTHCFRSGVDYIMIQSSLDPGRFPAKKRGGYSLSG